MIPKSGIRFSEEIMLERQVQGINMHDGKLISHDEVQAFETYDDVSPIIVSRKPMQWGSNIRAILALGAAACLISDRSFNWIDGVVGQFLGG